MEHEDQLLDNDQPRMTAQQKAQMEASAILDRVKATLHSNNDHFAGLRADSKPNRLSKKKSKTRLNQR